MQVERFLVDKDPKNCITCDFLKIDAGFSICQRLDKPIYQVDICMTGPMKQLLTKEKSK